MNDIKLFQITDEDKAHYKNIIKDIDTNCLLYTSPSPRDRG